MDANPYIVRRAGDGVEVVEDASGATWNVVREAGGYTVIRTQRVDGTAGLAEIWDDDTAAEIARHLGDD
jgi:hypothetical protein